jgi:O-antigen/teichoic acid export membrane protein
MTVLKKTAQIFFSHFLVVIQGLVFTPLILRVAGVETFGQYSLFSSYLGIIFGVSSFGVGVTARRWLPGADNLVERARLYYPQFWFQFISIIIICITLYAVVFGVFGTTQSFLLGVSSATVFIYLIALTLYSQSVDYFRFTHRIKIFSIATVIQPYLILLLVIACLYLNIRLNIQSIFTIITLSAIFVGAILFAKIILELGIQFQLPKIVTLRTEIALGFPIMLSFLVDAILIGGDRYVIAYLLSIRDVGIYVPAYVLGSLMLLVPKVFGVVLPPLLGKNLDVGNKNAVKLMMDQSAKFFLLLAIPYAFGAILHGKEILALYANVEVSEEGWMVVPIVAFASIFYGLTLLKSNIFYLRLSTKELFQVNLVCVVLNILLNIIFIKLFGNIIVSALATLISYYFSYLFVCNKLHKDKLYFNLDNNFIVIILIYSALMFLFLFFYKKIFDPQKFYEVMLSIILSVILYTILIVSNKGIRIEFRRVISELKVI